MLFLSGSDAQSYSTMKKLPLLSHNIHRDKKETIAMGPASMGNKGMQQPVVTSESKSQVERELHTLRRETETHTGNEGRVPGIRQPNHNPKYLNDWLGRSALHCAVENNQQMAVKSIIEDSDIMVNVGDAFGRTPLHWAAEKGFLDIMQLLLESGADVEAQDSFKQTALSRAAWRGRHECVSMLLDRGARSDIPDRNKQIPLHLAAVNGSSRVVGYLCEEQSLTAIDSEQSTCLHLAARFGHREAASILIEKMVSTNVNGDGIFRTLEHVDGWQSNFADSYHETGLLVWAALNGIESMVHRLIIGGADVQSCSSFCQMTAIQAAAFAGHIDIVKLLLDNEADINAESAEYYGRTALQAAAGAGHLEIVKLLLDNKADINADPAFFYGHTALQAAAGAGHIEIVKLLLDNKADINARPADGSGCTALQAAAGAGHIEIVNLLLDNKADINARPAYGSGYTALQGAAGAGHIEIVQLLLDNKADINAEPNYFSGRTALHAAVHSNHIEIVRLLLNNKADINAPFDGKSGLATLQAAADAGHSEILELLNTHVQLLGLDIKTGSIKSEEKEGIQKHSEKMT